MLNGKYFFFIILLYIKSTNLYSFKRYTVQFICSKILTYHLLTLKGRCILQTKGRDNWGGGHYGPPIISALGYGKKLIFSGY